jgi:hypothetical protein
MVSGCVGFIGVFAGRWPSRSRGPFRGQSFKFFQVEDAPGTNAATSPGHLRWRDNFGMSERSSFTRFVRARLSRRKPKHASSVVRVLST